jgi:hypothetical protein
MPNVISLIPKTPKFNTLNSLYRIEGQDEWTNNYSFNALGTEGSGIESPLSVPTSIVEDFKEQNKFNKDIVSISIGHKIINGTKTQEVCLTIGVLQKRPLSEIDNKNIIQQSFRGFRTDIIEDTIHLPRSINPGQSINIASGGTIAIAVKDVYDDSIVYLTCNHVISNNIVYDEDYDAVGNGGETQASAITRIWSHNGHNGNVKKIKPIKYSPTLTPDNFIDCGALSLNVKDLANCNCPGLRNGDNILVENGPYPFANPNEISIGTNVFRVSSSSGVVTSETIENINYHTIVNYNNYMCHFNNQIRSVGPNSAEAGDSGSPTFINVNGVTKFLGIIFAASTGYSVICPAWYIAMDLNVKSWNGDIVLPFISDRSLSMFNRNYKLIGYTRTQNSHTHNIIQ